MSHKTYLGHKGYSVYKDSLSLKEQADAESDTAGEGQIWVNTATPNQLYFTDDAGYDQKVSGGTAYRVHFHNSWVMGG